MCRESLVHNRRFLTVAIEDLESFDPQLSEKIRRLPADFLPLVNFGFFFVFNVSFFIYIIVFVSVIV